MSRPLLCHYKALETGIPYVPLVDAPTPVEPFNGGGINTPALEGLWIKRDDKTSAVYAGNKIRKLEFILAEAKRRYQIVTIGAIGTNHGVATAVFARLHGLKSRILLFDQPVTNGVIHNLKLMKAHGAELEYRGGMISAMLYYYFSRLVHRRSYFLPPGGSNIAGSLGFVNAAFELKQQIEQGEMPEPDRIICPVSSGGTLAGLTLGCQLAGLQCKVQGVRVIPSHWGIIPVCTDTTVARLMQQVYRYLRGKSDEVPLVQLREIDLLGDYCGEGYGYATDEGDCATGILRERGIVLEPTYTAKAAAAALQACRDNPHETILYWHTFNSVVLSPDRVNADLAALPKALRKRL